MKNAAIINGQFCIIAETACDGYDIARLEREADAAGRVLRIVKNGNGSIAIAIDLPDLGLARSLGVVGPA